VVRGGSGVVGNMVCVNGCGNNAHDTPHANAVSIPLPPVQQLVDCACTNTWVVLFDSRGVAAEGEPEQALVRLAVCVWGGGG
jgi:hypothetical protein